MSQANYVTPVLNQPIDPFLQEQLEEERRYKEAQDARRREEGIQDFAIEQALRNKYANERFDKDQASRLAWNKKSARMQRRFKEKDLEADRAYATEQSKLMAGELPSLRDKISAKQAQLMDLDRNLLVGDTSQGKAMNPEAYQRTVDFNERMLGVINSRGIPVSPPTANRGAIMQSTNGFQSWLASAVPAEQAGQILSLYAREVDKEKQTIKGGALAPKYAQLTSSMRQLMGREATILKAVEGGGIDYSAYDSAPPSGAAQAGIMPATGPVTMDEQREVEQEMAKVGLSGLEGSDLGDALHAGGEANREEAYSGVAEMNDLWGNWDSGADNEEAFQNILASPATSIEQKNKQLQLEIDAIEEAEAALETQFQIDYKDAKEDWFHWGIGSPMDDSPDTKQWDPNVAEVEADYRAIKGAYGAMKQRLYQAMGGHGADGRAARRSIIAPAGTPGPVGPAGPSGPQASLAPGQVGPASPEQVAEYEALLTSQGSGPSGDSLYMGGDPHSPLGNHDGSLPG